MNGLVQKVQENLSDDLLKKSFKSHSCNTGGHCYVASEALYHLLGGKDAGYTPMNINHEGVSHWFLRHSSGQILDPTAEQFKTKVPYDKARGRGFLTKQPSKRAQTLMKRVKS